MSTIQTLTEVFHEVFEKRLNRYHSANYRK